jgi:metal-dependent amidase/aminoacylase/carboxypeptidase family protein
MRHSFVALLILPVLVMTPPSPAAAQLPAAVDRALVRGDSAFVALRRDLHQHPELSGEESRTAGIVARRLTALGLEVRTGVGGYGVVGILRGGRPGPLVAYRADMDAVRSNAPDPVAFPSLTPGVRHICGHDLHTAIGLAIAAALAANKGELRGSVMFLFQPAEERAEGAERMLEDGAFLPEKPVAVYALHTAPLEVGRFATNHGPLMSGHDRVLVSISGNGNLRAVADSARALVASLATVGEERRLQPAPPTLVMVQTFPDRPSAEGTQFGADITLASPAVRAAVKARLQQELPRLGREGITVRVAYQEKSIAGVTNDSLLVRRADAAIRALYGDTAVIHTTTVLPAFSEDFGAFQTRVPGVMYFLGVNNAAKGTVGMPHTPDYVADEGAILIGARAMTAVLLERLAASSAR